jgi:hypothetical protein
MHGHLLPVAGCNSAVLCGDYIVALPEVPQLNYGTCHLTV